MVRSLRQVDAPRSEVARTQLSRSAAYASTGRGRVEAVGDTRESSPTRSEWEKVVSKRLPGFVDACRYL